MTTPINIYGVVPTANPVKTAPPIAIFARRQLAFGKFLIKGMGNPQSRNLLSIVIYLALQHSLLYKQKLLRYVSLLRTFT